MYIEAVHIYVSGELPPPLAQLEESVSFRFDKRANLFIGPNASGKSTMLRVIKSVSTEEFEADSLNGDLVLSDLLVDLSDLPDDWYINGDGWVTREGIVTIADTVPVLFIPATRVNLPVRGTLQGYRTDDALKSLFDTDSAIFCGQYVQGAIDQLRERSTYDSTLQTQLRKALVAGYSCAREICGEVIRADVPSAYSDISDRGRAVHYGMGIVTNDNIDDILGEPLYAGVLSSGTQGTLLWIYALALKMASHYDWEEGWDKKPAILLIDEIENHLHPTWQRRVIPALLKHFPKLQIFATTHSPFVVAGLKAGQVHLLNRDANGVVTATTNEQDVIGWTADEILRTMMGVDDPTDDDTAKAAAELRELRRELPKADEKEEELRQQRIQELRQRVDRDLLAGGPAAAQRELFEQQFAEALEKYRQSQGLNQDNG